MPFKEHEMQQKYSIDYNAPEKGKGEETPYVVRWYSSIAVNDTIEQSPNIPSQFVTL